MPFDLDELLRPIPGANPIGGDLRDETGINSLYFKLKDARAQARTFERATEAAGETPTIPFEWQTVRALAIEALQNRSKDLEVAAWLIEALLRLEDFAGLSASFVLVKRLAETFWPLHSIDEDDITGRVSPLAGLNGIGGDGALIQPIRMVSLLPGGAFGSNALWHLSCVQKEPDGTLAREFNDARTAAGMAAIRDRAIQASSAREAFIEMTATLDTLCGADSPPSSNIRNALDAVLDAYRSLIGGADIAVETAATTATTFAAAVSGTTETVDAPANGSMPSGAFASREIATREEAFTELLRIADFFRRMEPHSPLSYALETLVTRGRMTFIDLLEELMPDAANRRNLLQSAGIHASVDGKTHQ